MPAPEEVIQNSDSLIDLLGAQCSDLEQLLALAREETTAAKEGRFLKVWDIVSERAEIGKRLETCQQQIAELRGHLESRGENPGKYDITNRVIELANQTIIQDQMTHRLLAGSRDQAAEDLINLDRTAVRTTAYMHGATKGLAYNQSF